MTPSVIRRLSAAGGDEPADAELLARFVADRDAAAFELLVWRHAALVLRACRAVLRDHHAAEDAAQATFLALARQASAVRGGTVAEWLFRVARRVAGRAARRDTPLDIDLDQFPAAERPEPDTDAAAVLHEELARLPERYRLPVLLCFFEGRTHAEAARVLGWPVGTVAGRLARAKSRLAAALTRRGVTLAIPVIVVPPAFARTTAAVVCRGAPASPTVLALARQEVRMTTATKLFRVTALVTACAGMTLGVWAAPRPQPPADAKKPAEVPRRIVPVVEKSFAVAPVTTDLQRRMVHTGPPTVAVVFLNGEVVLPPRGRLDLDALDLDMIERSLRVYPADKSRSVFFMTCHPLLAEYDKKAEKVLRYGLEGLGRSLGFGAARAFQSFGVSDADWDKYIAPLRENKGGELNEPATGDERAKAYPIRTPLGRMLTGVGDCVVDVIPQLDAAAEDWVPAAVEKSVHEAIKLLAVPKGGKARFLFHINGDRDNNVHDRVRTLAKKWAEEHGLELESYSL
jgi:RNA polymerase sigma factor (sigma-70 family)